MSASALVNVFTAGKRVMPMYAVQGCDYGLQTLADPANGHTTPVVPTLAFDTDTNTTDITPLSQELKNSTGNVVGSLTLGSTGNTVSFEAKNWVNATKIGFFRGDNPLPALVQEASSYWLESDTTKTTIAPPSPRTTSARSSWTSRMPWQPSRPSGGFASSTRRLTSGLQRVRRWACASVKPCSSVTPAPTPETSGH